MPLAHGAAGMDWGDSNPPSHGTSAKSPRIYNASEGEMIYASTVSSIWLKQILNDFIAWGMCHGKAESFSLEKAAFLLPFYCFFLKLLRVSLLVKEGYLLGFVSCLVMKAWARQAILFIIYLIHFVCASDISYQGSEDHSQENCVTFLQLPAEPALCLPRPHQWVVYRLQSQYDILGCWKQGVCAFIIKNNSLIYTCVNISELRCMEACCLVCACIDQ